MTSFASDLFTVKRSRKLSAASGEPTLGSEHDLDDTHYEFLRRENRQQEWQQGSCSGCRKACYVLKSEGNRTHIAYQAIAIAEVGQRLNVSGSEQFLRIFGVREYPFAFKTLDIPLRKQSVV